MIDSQKEPLRRGVIFQSLFLFFIAFSAVAGLVHLALPNPLSLHADIRSEKLSILNDWRTQATSAAFGSSHVHDGFDPRAFDQTLGDSRIRAVALNLGVEGGSQVEQRLLALQFLKTLRPHPGQACFVLLEVNAGANFTNDHLVHPRAINAYDWQSVRFVSSLSSRSIGTSRAAGRIGYALLASMMYYTNTGMLSSLLFHPPLDEEAMRQETKDDRRGLHTPILAPGAMERNRELLTTLSPEQKPQPEAVLPGQATLIDELANASTVHNLKFVYYVFPRIDNLAHIPIFPESVQTTHGLVPVINLGIPNRYPELYQAQHWVDDSHLSASGAAMATTHLVEQLNAWYSAHPQSMECQ